MATTDTTTTGQHGHGRHQACAHVYASTNDPTSLNQAKHAAETALKCPSTAELRRRTVGAEGGAARLSASPRCPSAGSASHGSGQPPLGVPAPCVGGSERSNGAQK